MTKTETAKIVATAAGAAAVAAVASVAAYALIVGTWKWVLHDVRNVPE